MAHTERRTYRGEVVRDGRWCRRCWSTNCDICETGMFRLPSRRRRRRVARHLLRVNPEAA